MKKQYSKPSLEVEVYQLNAAIAGNCGDVVSLGPWAPGKETCNWRSSIPSPMPI